MALNHEWLCASSERIVTRPDGPVKKKRRTFVAGALPYGPSNCGCRPSSPVIAEPLQVQLPSGTVYNTDAPTQGIASLMILALFARLGVTKAESFNHIHGLVDRYARKLPLSVICELLGLPDVDRPRFIAWAKSLTRLTGMVGFLRMLAGIGPMKRYLEGRLQVARETGGEGLIAELVRVEKEGGQITGQEMVAMVFLLLGAGSETTRI